MYIYTESALLHSFLLFCNFKTRKKGTFCPSQSLLHFSLGKGKETAIKSKKNCFSPPTPFSFPRGNSERQKCSTVICLSGSVALGWLCDPATDGGSSHCNTHSVERQRMRCAYVCFGLAYYVLSHISCGSSVTKKNLRYLSK